MAYKDPFPGEEYIEIIPEGNLIHSCRGPAKDGLERVKYFPRMLLAPDDMIAEQVYFREKLRRHNRYLHGWGVVCGLKVIAKPRKDGSWCLHIDEGYALGPYGDEIYVPPPGVDLDLAAYGPDAVTDPCDPARVERTAALARGQSFYIAIKYAECPTRPVRAMPAGCGCEEELCEYARIIDGFELGCLVQLPSQPEAYELCDFADQMRIPKCPPCPTEPWVVLAQVTLPASQEINMNDNIDNSVRRQIVSTAVLQAELERCCCKEQTTKEATADVEVNNVNYNFIETEGRFKIIQFNFYVVNMGEASAENVTVTSLITEGISQIVRVADFEIHAENKKMSNEFWKDTDAPGPFKAYLGTVEYLRSFYLTFKVFLKSPQKVKVVNHIKAHTDTKESNYENNEKTIDVDRDTIIL